MSAAIEQRLAARVAEGSARGSWQTVVTANRAVLSTLGDFEDALEDQSAVGRLLRPPTQALLSTWAGAGNERVYVGRAGWLFYRPDVEYVTGRGFLEESQQRRRVAAVSEYDAAPQPDPRPAILAFKQALDARGVTLILMPTPVKPSIHPAQLSARFDDSAVVQNASFEEWLSDLEQHGALVFDPAPVIAAWQGGAPQYLVTDTHWRPETMQRVAEALAAFLTQHVTLPARDKASYSAERREARSVGDTAAMLDLPPDQTVYPPERVTLRFIVDAAGDPWRSTRDADVLLLGDSFTNIYSLPSMGWGEAAGFAEQLSFVLQRPLDRIVQNDQGARATRAILQREIASGSDRLAGKRLVIWQFAARELASGDWR
jgi:alginate O-acetyltransferase complex protein AlgJ